MKIQSGWLLITGILILIILFQRACQKPCDDTPNNSDTILIHDSSVHVIYVPKPFPVNHYYNHSDTFLKDVDSGAILKEFFTTFIYQQTLTDSNLKATISDTITENKIAARGFQYQILRPETTIINTTTPLISKNKVFIGIGIGTDKTFAPALSPMLTFQTKKEKQIAFGYDILNQQYQLSLSTKIKLKK